LANALRARALRLLARREMSRAELRTKLGPFAASLAELDALLDDLMQSKLQSDARFTEALVHRRAPRLGTARIAAELREKGVAPELADEAIAALRADETARARAVWRRKFRHLPATREERAKQGRFLMSRGFSADTVRKVLSGDPGAGEEDVFAEGDIE
jgi:regulatory protein